MVWPLPQDPSVQAVMDFRTVPVGESRWRSTTSALPKPVPVVDTAVPGEPFATVMAGCATTATAEETHGPITPSWSTYWT